MYARQMRLRTPQATATADHREVPCLSTDDNTRSSDITDALVQLRGASTDERELHIIYDTITV
jgi:hypothetical protein